VVIRGSFKQVSVGFFLFSLITSVAYAQFGLTYRRILLPVVVDRPLAGAFGSQWQTELGLTNVGTSAMWVYPIQFVGINCSMGCASPYTQLPAGVTSPSLIYYFGIGTPPSNGFVLHAEDQYADSLRVSLRVHDLSRQDKSWGATIPVVPESRFANSVSLPALPGEDQNFRVNVRIYSFTTDTPVQVNVQAFATSPFVSLGPPKVDVMLGSQSFSLASPMPDVAGTPTPPAGSHPSYLMIGDLKSITGGSTSQRYRLEISSATPGATIWAFATITNNDTQEVTVVGPAEH
jgi:hypothetical protein